MKECAFLMAAGKGERMRPITEKIPKPLVKVHGTPMIETVIAGLERRGVEKIYVIVGYLKEQFSYLPEKYKNITLVENTEFETVNNISSIRAVADLMGKEDCFICEADLYVSDPGLFDKTPERSCYFGKMVPGHSDDWVFDLKDNRIVRVGKYGDDAYNMCGISYFKAADAKIVADKVKARYHTEGFETLFWDDVVNENLDVLNLAVEPIDPKQIVEIDTVAELKAIDTSYAVQEK